MRKSDYQDMRAVLHSCYVQLLPINLISSLK